MRQDSKAKKVSFFKSAEMIKQSLEDKKFPSVLIGKVYHYYIDPEHCWNSLRNMLDTAGFDVKALSYPITSQQLQETSQLVQQKMVPFKHLAKKERRYNCIALALLTIWGGLLGVAVKEDNDIYGNVSMIPFVGGLITGWKGTLSRVLCCEESISTKNLVKIIKNLEHYALFLSDDKLPNPPTATINLQNTQNNDDPDAPSTAPYVALEEEVEDRWRKKPQPSTRIETQEEREARIDAWIARH